MRMMLNVKIPHDVFNAAVKDGTASGKIRHILEETQAEVVYFTEQNGQRSAILVINMDDPSEAPKFAEPWFLTFNADVEFKIAMTPDDLKKAGLEELAKRWS